MAERPEPEGRLAPQAVWVWRLEFASAGAVAFLIAYAVGRALRHHAGATHTIGGLLPWLTLAAVVGTTAVVPMLRARRWRWRLDDDELDLRHGVITDVRTLIPVARIQHVDIKRSAFAQLAGVAAVVVHTAAGRTEIPSLSALDAARVRDRLAGLIRTPDDE